MQLPVNTLLQGGKYKIIRFISSGGFGCTYEAEHVMLEKRMAIKEFFVKDFCNRDDATANVTVGTLSKKGLVDKLRRKFIDEAKALCRLQHQGIVHVSDVFEENGTAYFVMDYIEGQSLSDIVNNNGSIPERKALKYMRQVAEALQYVHAHNRLHLDVKPANIMIDKNDNAVLIDFGASKQYDEQDGENTSTLLGKTPGYAPLEQMGNDVVKFIPATDIYALGATFYKVLCGITPPSAHLLASGDATVKALSPDISVSTRKAIAAAMALNKKKRPQTIDEFIGILSDGVQDMQTDDVTVIGVSKSQEAVNETWEKTAHSGIISKRNCCLIPFVVFCILVVGLFLLPDTPENGTGNDVGNNTVEAVVKKISYTNSKGITFIYSGPTNPQGAPEGTGIGEYKGEEGGIYHGEYKNGIREGKGEFDTGDNSNHFKGIFKDDSYYEGTLTIKEDGSYYTGTFKNKNFWNGKWHKKNGSFDSEMRKGKLIQ